MLIDLTNLESLSLEQSDIDIIYSSDSVHFQYSDGLLVYSENLGRETSNYVRSFHNSKEPVLKHINCDSGSCKIQGGYLFASNRSKIRVLLNNSFEEILDHPKYIDKHTLLFIDYKDGQVNSFALGHQGEDSKSKVVEIINSQREITKTITLVDDSNYSDCTLFEYNGEYFCYNSKDKEVTITHMETKNSITFEFQTDFVYHVSLAAQGKYLQLSAHRKLVVLDYSVVLNKLVNNGQIDSQDLQLFCCMTFTGRFKFPNLLNFEDDYLYVSLVALETWYNPPRRALVKVRTGGRYGKKPVT